METDPRATGLYAPRDRKTSATSAKRRAGSISRHRSIVDDQRGSASGATERAVGARSRILWRTAATGFFVSNGTRPVTISKRTTPNA